MASQRVPLIPDGGLSRSEFLKLTGAAVGSAALVGVPGAESALAASPTRGGSLRLGNTADVLSFEPYAVSDNVSIWTMLLMYNQLTRPTPDGLHVEPDL